MSVKSRIAELMRTKTLAERIAEVDEKLRLVGAYQQDGDNSVLELQSAVDAMWDLLKDFLQGDFPCGSQT